MPIIEIRFKIVLSLSLSLSIYIYIYIDTHIHNKTSYLFKFLKPLIEVKYGDSINHNSKIKLIYSKSHHFKLRIMLEIQTILQKKKITND